MGVFLTDFGLARHGATGSRYTRSGEAFGTPAYMSPEQARGEVHELRPATDVWALGAILYELLAGRPAFEGTVASEVILRVLREEPPPLAALHTGLPPALEAVVRAALAKDAVARYVSARDLRDDLDRLRRGEAPQSLPPAPRPRRHGRTLAVAGAVAAAVAVVALPRWRPDAPPVATTATDSAAERRARAAWAGRLTDPAAALQELDAALTDAPGRHDLRLLLGLVAWALADVDRADAAWAAVPADAPETTRAAWLRGLCCAARAADAARPDLETQARLHWSRAAAGQGPEAAWAAAGLARDGDEAIAAREVLASARSWEAALILGLREVSRPRPDLALAARCFDHVLTEGLPLALAYTNRGVLRAMRGDPQGAVADLDAALARDPASPRARYNRATVRNDAGDTAGAVADVASALAAAPHYAPALTLRAHLRIESGDLRGAAEDLQAAVATGPDLGSWRAARGRLRLESGDLAEAIREFDAALAEDPELISVRMNRGLARSRSGDHAGALADLDAAVAMRGGNPTTWMNRGTVRRAQGDLPGARADLDHAIALTPDAPEARINRASLRQFLGDLAGAEADLDVALDTVEGFASARAATTSARVLRARALTDRSVVRYRRANPDRALADADAVLRVVPGYLDARTQRGLIRRAIGDLPGARADLDAVLAADPKHVNARANRGLVRCDAGDLAGALEDLTRALADAPAGWEMRGKLEAEIDRVRALAGVR